MGGVMAAVLKAGDQLQPVTHEVTNDKMIEFEKCVWDRGRNSHSDINAAKADGIQRTIASGQNQMAFLHELMERNFGDAWVYGGKISVRSEVNKGTIFTVLLPLRALVNQALAA